jgi:hypothetical protein
MVAVPHEIGIRSNLNFSRSVVAREIFLDFVTCSIQKIEELGVYMLVAFEESRGLF